MKSVTRKAVSYHRVSTADQAENGVSLAAQREKTAQYADLYDVQIVSCETDRGISGKTLQRPGLQRALRLLEDGSVDCLLVVKLDRLTRSVRDLGTLVERYFGDGKRALLSVTEQIDTRTAAGRLVLNVLGSVSQWERETIGERTSFALRHKARNGEFTGGVLPYGYTRDPGNGKRLIPDAGEQEVIHEAVQLRGLGWSLRRIAVALNAQGHQPRRAACFGPVQVQRMLARRRGV